ncbi:Protein kinase domain containing protein [Leishmania braziliensis]|nr:Protein kinase domain containing protein [Leishmania braziliensis]
MAARAASWENCVSVLSHPSDDEQSIVECEVLDERAELAGTVRYSPAPTRRGGATAGGIDRGTAAVPSDAVGDPHGEPFSSRRLSGAQHQSSRVHQPRLSPLPPPQHFGRGDDFMGVGREVGFNDSVDGFPLYVDDDGVMMMSRHRRRDPFAFVYDAVEEGDFAMVDDRRSSYHGDDGIVLGSSSGSSDGVLVSGSSSYSSSLYEEPFQPSLQHRSRAYRYGLLYSGYADAAARFGYPTLAVHYGEGTGALLAYDGGAPVPIDAALPSHGHVASRRRRLVGVGSSVYARPNAKRRRSTRKKGKRPRRGSTGSGRPGRTDSRTTGSPHAPAGRHGSYREGRNWGHPPTRLSGSGSLSASTNPLLNIIGGVSVAATTSATAAAGIPSGLSSLFSTGVPIKVGHSEAGKAVRMREHLLAREAEMKKRYAELRRGTDRTVRTGAAADVTRGPRQKAVAATLYGEFFSRTGDGADSAAYHSDAIAAQSTRGTRSFSPLSMSLKDLKRCTGLQTGREGGGKAFALATTHSGRSRAKGGASSQSQLATTEKGVCVRADPTPAAAAARGRGGDGKFGVACSDSAPGRLHDAEFAAGTATHPEQRMMAVCDPYTSSTVALAYAPLAEAAATAAVHTCAAGIQFFRDPSVSQSAAVALLPSSSSALPETPSQLLPTTYLLDVGNPPLAPTLPGAAAISDGGSLHASFSALYPPSTPPTAITGSAVYLPPSSFQSFSTPHTSTAKQLQPWQPPCRGSVGEEPSKSRSPSPLMMGRPPFVTSLLPHQLRSRGGVTSMDRLATEATDRDQLERRLPTTTALFRDVSPGLAARGENAGAGALPTVAASGSGGTTSLDVRGPCGSGQSIATALSFGDDARSRRRLQSGAAGAADGYGTAAVPAVEVDVEGSADLLPWCWRRGASAFGMGVGEDEGGDLIAATSQEEGARGWPGVLPGVAHLRGTAGGYAANCLADGALYSTSATMPSSFAWPYSVSPLFAAPLQLPVYPPSIAPYTTLPHPPHNTRYHAWTAEGVSATSNTSCMVHVFTVSRKMLHRVYEYVAYMCVAKRYAELQRRCRKREEHLIKELAAGRLTRGAQRRLHCPHCGAVGKVVRKPASPRDGQALPSHPFLVSTLTQSQPLRHNVKHQHNRNPCHSRSSHRPSLASTTTTNTTTTPLLFLRRSASSASSPLELPLSQQQQTESLGWSLRMLPSPKQTSMPPQPSPRLDSRMGSATQDSSRVTSDVGTGRIDERQSAPRALVIDEVNAVLEAPRVSAVPHSSPDTPDVRAERAPLTRNGSSTSGLFPALLPSAWSTSLPPLRLQRQQELQEENRSSQEYQYIQSMSVFQLSSASATQSSSPILSPPPLLPILPTVTTASPPLTRPHASPRASSSPGVELTGITNSSETHVDALLNFSVGSRKHSHPLHMNSLPYEPSAQTISDGYAGASSNDLCAPQQRTPTAELTRGADEAVAASLPHKSVEECSSAIDEGAAVQQSSSRAALANSNCKNDSHSFRVGDIDSNDEDERLERAESMARQASELMALQRQLSPGEFFPDTRMPPPSLLLGTPTTASPDRSKRMAASADLPVLKCAPPAAANAANVTRVAISAASNSQVRGMGSSMRSNPNINNMSSARSLLSPMLRSALTPALLPLTHSPSPPQGERGEEDEGSVAAMQCWRDMDSPETTRNRRRSDDPSYVCLGCHHDVIPKLSLLTSIGDYCSSRRHSQLVHHHSAARRSQTTNNSSGSGVSDADVDRVGAEETVSADIGVIAFDDLLQDDALVYALHTSLCKSLMMPSTREPPSLPTTPHKRRQKRRTSTSPARADRNSFLHPVLAVTSAHQIGASPTLSQETRAVAATVAESEGHSVPAQSVSTPSCHSSCVLNQRSPAAIRGVSAVSSQSIISDIDDGQREPTTFPLSISAASSSFKSLTLASSEISSAAAGAMSSTLKGCTVVVADKEGVSCSAAPLPTRLLLPCCGLTVSVLPYVEPQVPSAEVQGRLSDSGSKHQGPAERHLPRMSNPSSKNTGSAYLPRRRSSTSASLPRPAIPRMREDAATRGLTPSVMLLSSAAASHDCHNSNNSKQPYRLRNPPSTPPRQRHRSSESTVATKLSSPLTSSPNGPMMHSAVAPIALMMKGTFSSEKHRIQVNPRTPLDTVSKNRIMARIFHQDRHSSRRNTAAAAAVIAGAASRSYAGVTRLSRAEKHSDKGSDSIAGAERRGRATGVNSRSGAAGAAGVPIGARSCDTKRQRWPHHRVHSYTRAQAQKQAHLLLPPSRVPKPLGVNLGIYRDPSLVLEIELAYPRLHRGNVRELLAEWKYAYQPHPVLVEAVIRNIVYAVLVQLAALHAVGRTHGSVKSTNVFPLWHAVESMRESGLMMPPRPQRHEASPPPLVVAHEKCEPRPLQEEGRKAEAVMKHEEKGERRRSVSAAEGEGVCEPGGAPAAEPHTDSQAALALQEYATEELTSAVVNAAVGVTLNSPAKSRSLSNQRRRRGPHTAAAHPRLHQQTRLRDQKTQSSNKAVRSTGTVPGVPSVAKCSSPAALSRTSLTATVSTSSTGRATAIPGHCRRSASGGTGSDNKQVVASTNPRMPGGQSHPSSRLSSPSTAFSSAPMLLPAPTSVRSSPAPLSTVDALQSYHADITSRRAGTFSPARGTISNSRRLRRCEGVASQPRRGSIGINVGGRDGVCDPNSDAEEEDDSSLVPLVAEVLAAPSTVLRVSASKEVVATAELGTDKSQTRLQNSSSGTPGMHLTSSYSSCATLPRHRDHHHGHHRRLQRRGSWSAEVEDPEEWLASAAPPRYVRGVELRPPATVWFPRVALDKVPVASEKPSVDHGVLPPANSAMVLENVSDVAAQPVLTRGPVGAVPQPQLDSVGRAEVSTSEIETSDGTRHRGSSAGPSMASSSALHGALGGAGQDAPDPLHWSRQVLLVDNVGAAVAAALRTAMTCVLMQHPPLRHSSSQPSSPAFLTSTLKTPISRSDKARHAATAVADHATVDTEMQGIHPPTSLRSTAAAASTRRKSSAAAGPTLNVHVPDVVRSPPPLPPNLFSIQESEYVPAPELIRWSADEAFTLRRPWRQQPGDAAAATAEADGEGGAGEYSGFPRSSTTAGVDAWAESAARLRDVLAPLEATAPPMTTLRNTLDPYPALSTAVDIWGLGMMALELADGPPPMSWLKQREPAPTLRTYPWSSYFRAFVSLCLQRAPEQRSTAVELLQHPWFGVALVPQASSLSPPTTIQSSGGVWYRGTVGSDAAGVPVEARNLVAVRQSGKAGGPAPVSSLPFPLLSVRPPGVMGVDCLTAEEKAEWENYDYTLLYASGAQSMRPLTTTAAAASAAVASTAEDHHQKGSSGMRLESSSRYEPQGVTTCVSSVSARERNNRATGAVDSMSVGELPPSLALGGRRMDAPSQSPAVAAAAVALPSQSSALTVPSAGGGTAVTLPSAAAASSSSTAKDSANDELMTAMCAVDLAQNFAELITQQWVQQQQQLIPPLATSTGAYGDAGRERQALLPFQRSFFTAAAASASLDGASTLPLSLISPRPITTRAVAAAYGVLSPRSSQSAAAQGAVLPQHQQPSEWLFSQIIRDEKVPLMWGGHSKAFSNNALLCGQTEVAPAISPHGAPSPLPLLLPNSGGGGVVQVLPTHLPALYVPLHDARGDTMLTAAHALVSPWTERMMSEWGGTIEIQSPLQSALSSATHGASAPWFQLSAGVTAGGSTPLMYPALQVLPGGDGSASGSGGGCPTLYWDRGVLDASSSTSSVRSGDDWDRGGSSPHHGRHARATFDSSRQSSSSSSPWSDSTSSGTPRGALCGSHSHISKGSCSDVHGLKVSGEVPELTRTPAPHLNGTFSTAATLLTDDATGRGVFKLGTPKQRGGGDRNMVFCDPTTGGGAAAVKEGVSFSSSYAAAPKLLPRSGNEDCSRHEQQGGSTSGGGDGDYGAVPRLPSSFRPTRHLLTGTIATALARLSMMAYLSSDTEEQWSETSTSTATDSSSDEDSTIYSDGSGSCVLSSMWGVSACQSTPLESDDRAACMQGGGDSSDVTNHEELDEDDDGQSMSAEVRCDELLRCLSVLQRSCPAAISLWCVRVLQQAMRHPQTAAAAVRVLERIESVPPAERSRNLGWLKQPDSSLSPPTPLLILPDPLGANDTQRGGRAAAPTGAGRSSLSAVAAAVGVSPHASRGSLPPPALDASPSNFQNYEMAKWMYAVHQALPRCT